MLLRDGDLIVFGTQRHGVPEMPEVGDGRISVPIFFWPHHLQQKEKFQTVHTGGDGGDLAEQPAAAKGKGAEGKGKGKGKEGRGNGKGGGNLSGGDLKRFGA